MRLSSKELQEMLGATAPGPWTTNISDFGMSNTGGAYVAVYDENSRTLAHILCRDTVGKGCDYPFAANARLIAAAPELAAELLQLRKALWKISKASDDVTGASRLIAIAKEALEVSK